MSGHLEEAVATLSAAADQVRSQAAAAVDHHLNAVKQQISQVGSTLRERLVQETSAAQSQVLQILERLGQSIEENAQQLRRVGA
ncbi:hypothetical protein [Actinokineospora iranica]|uniref:Uncharacterized protein n=1 Tax=Actinokineospora iranica TaxID=1271860 RepID=A0A1G6VWV2_9PSEU|nr:hypothetical protein [Actinokineospora iranica]SDD57994.1 hypothetical protein SAMN05216174_113138 [Actinokineospora iranica]